MAAFQRGFLTFHAIFAVWETRRCIRRTAKAVRSGRPRGRTRWRGYCSSRRREWPSPATRPCRPVFCRSLRRSDTHGLHNVSTTHRQRLHRHRPAAARHGAARAATPTGLRPRRHEPPPRSGVGTHPTAPSPARRGGRRAGDGRRRPDGADTRAGVRPTPARERHTCWPYRGFTWGWFSSTSICCWEPSRCCTAAISCAMRRPSPSSGSSPRRRGCRRHDPRRRDVHGPATGAGPRRRATQASTSSPRRPSGCCCGGRPISSTSGSSCRSSPWRRSSYGGSRSTGDCARRGGRRTPRWECSSSARSPRRRRRRSYPTASGRSRSSDWRSIRRHPAHLRGGRGIAAVAGDPLAAPFGRRPSAARRAAVAAKPAGRRSGRPALCRDRLPDDGGADRRGLSLFRNFHPRGIPSVAEKSVTLPA